MMNTLQLAGGLILLFIQIRQTVSVTTDEECFFSNYKQPNRTSESEDTFDVRVEGEHVLLFSHVITLPKDEVVNVSTSGQWMNFCATFFLPDSFCNGTNGLWNVPDWDLPDEERNLFLVFDGTSVCGGMEEKEVRINSTEEIPIPVNKKCHYHCIDAMLGPDAPKMEFPYYHWFLDVDVDSLIPPPSDYTNKMIVKAGSSVNIAVSFIVLGLAFSLQLF